MKRILMVAFHAPPGKGFSGTQRTMAFCRHLPAYGWSPHLLTVRPLAYPAVDRGAPLPPGLAVSRQWALDAARHLSVMGRYFRFTALPDRWASWCWLGVGEGLSLIRRIKPDLIWSTYPIATAHQLAGRLAAASGVPWVADFRDPMLRPADPPDPVVRASFGRIEAHCAQTARRLVFANPALSALFQDTYPHTAPRCRVVENGFDPEESPLSLPPLAAPSRRTPLRLLHSGHLYEDADDRNPERFLRALASLQQAGALPEGGVQVILRGSGNEGLFAPMIHSLGLADVVQLAPAVSHRASLGEMGRAHGLLIFQGPAFNRQVPAKLYEYLQMGRPLLAVTDPSGETARVMGRMGYGTVAPWGDEAAIRGVLAPWLATLFQGEAALPAPEVVALFSRTHQIKRLAAILDEVHEEGVRA